MKYIFQRVGVGVVKLPKSNLPETTFDTKSNKIFNANCDNFLAQNVITSLTRNVTTLRVKLQLHYLSIQF